MIDVELPNAAEQRAALLAEMNRPAAGPAAAVPAGAVPWRRWLVPALAAGALAATVAVAALAVGGLTPDRPSPVAGASSVEGLRARLDTIDRTVKPQRGYNPSDYVYLRTRTSPGTDPAGITEEWISTGGGRNGAIMDAEGLRTTDPVVPRTAAGATQGVVTAVKYPTYVNVVGAQDIRVTDQDLYTELRRAAPDDGAIFAKVRAMLRVGGLVPPQTRTWLYRAALRVPGVTVRTGVPDVTGRSGTAIVLDRQVILLDPDDGSLLAETDAGTGAPGPAILSGAVVPYAGVRPAK
ncbi:hypothetical protein [Cryptosporangium sp. NPDC051539]|uniref:hypothetical protein n=1 Tax=Cryptosporangium sp. NPDC051539 TaxID=3363962 RepID=UPI0037A7A555